jgi:hypothetical protein
MIPILSGARDLQAQGLTWNPVLTAAGASDSNVFGVAGSAQSDRFATVIVDVPLSYKPSAHFELRARYLDAAEWYQKHPELKDSQARSQGQVGMLLEPRKGTQLRLDGNYGETNRPSEVFTDTGSEFRRARAKTWAGSTGLTQGLGEHTTLALNYAYRTGKVAGLEDRMHSVNASLMHHFSRRTELGLSWLFERRLSEAQERFDSNVVTAVWNQEVSPRLSLALAGGVRLSSTPFYGDALAQPEGRADLTWHRAHWQVRTTYAHTLGYAPRAASLAQRVGTTDTASWTVSFANRRWRLSAGPLFYWTRNDSLDVRALRVQAQTDLMLADWLGLSASYGYQQQNGTIGFGDAVQGADASRSVGRVGITLAPWNRNGAEGLP